MRLNKEKSQNYEPPMIEVIEVEVEGGFGDPAGLAQTADGNAVDAAFGVKRHEGAADVAHRFLLVELATIQCHGENSPFSKTPRGFIVLRRVRILQEQHKNRTIFIEMSSENTLLVDVFLTNGGKVGKLTP